MSRCKIKFCKKYIVILQFFTMCSSILPSNFVTAKKQKETLYQSLKTYNPFYSNKTILIIMTNHKDVSINITLNVPNAVDEIWLDQLNNFITKHLTESNLSPYILARHFKISERGLHDKVKKNTGFTPAQYIKEIRLQKAKLLLEHQSYSTVAETCYAVGFLRPIYFTKSFKKRFGILPSYLLKKISLNRVRSHYPL